MNRLCAAALVAVLLVVPPLVSALDGGGGPASWSIRLNRSGAASAAHVKLKPRPYDVAVHALLVAEERRLSRIIAGAAVLVQSRPQAPADRSPETRRGPPNARLA